MKTGKTDSRNLKVQKSNNDGNNLPGYPIYPDSEDIYNNYLEERDINPEDIHKTKELNEKKLEDEYPDHDLDIPGSELDDDMENIGSEDEENNYYSLGGDDHEDLEENQGE
ncbi:MAG: hypothetical protein Q8N05_21980 [Bacteroidota bacterium]|nr:hypothetical protein [Bacteroidota bacterium]